MAKSFYLGKDTIFLPIKLILKQLHLMYKTFMNTKFQRPGLKRLGGDPLKNTVTCAALIVSDLKNATWKFVVKVIIANCKCQDPDNDENLQIRNHFFFRNFNNMTANLFIVLSVATLSLLFFRYQFQHFYCAKSVKNTVYSKLFWHSSSIQALYVLKPRVLMFINSSKPMY